MSFKGSEEASVAAEQLDQLTWPEVQEEIRRGRDTVVMAFGATEQHGPHMAISTDRVLGEELTRRVADALDAFAAPAVPFGCSSHHLAFPGTISLSDATFHGIVRDVVSSLARGGFKRIILLPSHGGNFAPLATALEQLELPEGVRIDAITDISVLAGVAQHGAELGVPPGEGGLHAGEWETSMMLAIHPELVDMQRSEPGYTGDPMEAVGALFSQGVDSLSANGVIGDPAQASAEHGEAYWQRLTELALEALG
jgi:creatinine amidohydrolase/Fe(II)-dependent formamide hydrolase-like protein